MDHNKDLNYRRKIPPWCPDFKNPILNEKPIHICLLITSIHFVIREIFVIEIQFIFRLQEISKKQQGG